ncbi:MAG: hypothetical protein V7K53_10725 [Nostoc sp.]|uniref:hypothetical protein n=1 Tax=Nostoc sp. TaxID=1180 RepID=UPI002FF93C1D
MVIQYGFPRELLDQSIQERINFFKKPDVTFMHRNLLAERRATSQLVFEHLLWSLDVVKVCPHHQQKLSQKCPHCCQTNYVLAWRLRPGYCYKCLT